MLQQLLQFFKDHPEAGPVGLGGLVGVLVTLLGGRLVPYLWVQAGRGLGWLLGKLSSRYQLRQFEKLYLDWVITTHQDLKLAGVVLNEDAAKRPRLEQVFVSLNMAEEPTHGATQEDVEFLSERILAIQRPTLDRPDISERLRAYLGSLDEPRLKELRSALSQRPETTETEEQVRGLLAASMSRPTDALGESRDGGDHLQKILKEYTQIAILGGPGSGKTSLLQYVALAFARDRCGDPKLQQRGVWRRRLGVRFWRLPLLYLWVPLLLFWSNRPP
jgi:hypothetical protein